MKSLASTSYCPSIRPPELTRDRIYLETMEELYQQANKVVVDMPAGNNSMIHLPLDKLSGKANAVQPARPAGTPAVRRPSRPTEGANSSDPAAWR